MNAIDDVEQLVEATIRLITGIAQKATRFATKLLAAAVLLAAGGFVLGLAATSGGLRTVWIVLGIVFGAIAVGAALLARWRVGSIRKHVPELAGEVRTLLAQGKQAGMQIIDVIDDADADSAASSAIQLSRRVVGLRGVLGHGVTSSAKLSSAVTAITSFPGLAVTAIGISLVFGLLGLVFLLALALG